MKHQISKEDKETIYKLLVAEDYEAILSIFVWIILGKDSWNNRTEAEDELLIEAFEKVIPLYYDKAR